LHDQVVLVQVDTERVPHVAPSERIVLAPRVLFSGVTGDPVGDVASRITMLRLRFGYNDEPNVPRAVKLAAERGLIPGEPDIERATYFLSQITIVPTDAPGLSRWRKKLFVTMARNAASPASYFRLPDNRTVISSGRIQV
jgi:KUP system potassium uptake protein